MGSQNEASGKAAQQASARFDKKAVRLAMELQVLDGNEFRYGVLIHRLSVRMIAVNSSDVLVTVAAEDDDGRRIVGFHADEDAYEALRGCLERIANGQMKWRPDEYSS